MGDKESDLLALFRDERDTAVRGMSEALVALEAEPARRDLLEELFRWAHSLKGAAQAVGETRIAALCHELEEAFAEARPRPEELSIGRFQRLYALVDALGADDDGAAVPPVVGSAATRSPAPAGERVAAETLRVAPAKLDDVLRRVGEVLLLAQQGRVPRGRPTRGRSSTANVSSSAA